MTTKLLRILPIAILVVVAGCSSSRKTATSTTSTSTTSATATTVATPTTSSPATTVAPVSAGGPLPAGFTVADMTWVSDTEGWAVGTAPCAHEPCTSVVHTLDGGHSWAGLPAPRAYLEGDLLSSGVTCSATVACVQGIRFANATTGYAFGASSLWLTTDGGHTWSQHGSDSTDALEVTDGRVVRVTHPGVFGCPGCVFSVQTTTVGSTTWHSVGSPPSVVGDSAILAVAGSDLYVGAIGHTAGGAEDAHTQFARSSDLGAHWSTFADPCTVTPSGDEADATAISAAPGGYLVVACTPRVPNEAAFIVVSADAGATFGPHRFGLLSTVSPGGEFAVAVAAATGQRIAVLVSGNGIYSIAVTNDAGIDWTVTHSEPIPGTGASGNFLGFEDTTTGRAVVAVGTVLTTADGGGHWTGFTFP